MFALNRNHEALDLKVAPEKLKKSDWNKIAKSQNPALSEAFVEKYLDRLKLALIFKHQTNTISEAFIRKYASACTTEDWCAIARYQTLSEAFIREFHDKLPWYLLSEYQALNEDLIEEWRYKVDWRKVRSKQKSRVSQAFLKKFKHFNNRSEFAALTLEWLRDFPDKQKMNWCFILSYRPFSETFVREFVPYISVPEWNVVSYKLYEKRLFLPDFIEQFQDELNWYWISGIRFLPEDFVRRMRDKIHWSILFHYQCYREGFIEEFIDNIGDGWSVSHNQTLSEDFMRRHADRLQWYALSWKQKMSESFIREFADRIDWEKLVENKNINLSQAFRTEFNL